MTQTRQGADPAAMADILASIRRIVAEEDQRFERAPSRAPFPGDVLVLTPAMRIDAPPALPAASLWSDAEAEPSAPDAALSIRPEASASVAGP